MKKLLLTHVLLLMAVCALAQENKTSYITNPSFEDGLNGWVQTNMKTQTNSDFTKKAGNTYVEKWTASTNTVGNASVKQTIKNLPAGVYRLTVAAMNYSQSNKTKKNTGAYIFAGKVKETVYTPDDYSLEFTTVSGEVEIGFVASGATGNWLAVDNFRLYLIGEADAELVVEELQRIIGEAEALQESPMSSTASGELKTALDAAKPITKESAYEDIQTALLNLRAAVEHAENSIKECKTLTTLVATGESLQSSPMSGASASALKTAMETAQLISSASTDEEILAATEALTAAIADAKSSIADYKALNGQITKAEAAYDESKEGAADLKTEIDNAKALLENETATSEDIVAETEVLTKAIFAFNIANATPGTGTAPKVTKTVTYVATGATQALMRATTTGSNILEKGVCWSTEHEPTVLDNRTTKSFTLKGTIFHVTGLKPATVYYLRPYVMNKTYTVAYGEEVKIVTLPKGTARGTWEENGEIDEAANTRCRNAIKETIEYLNEWTGIKGFTLSGHYKYGAGSGSGTAQCSYGGYMDISQNAANQAIGTVLHETGHGVGVGTQERYWDKNVHDWWWYGRATTEAYQFLENELGNSEYIFKGDNTHAWGGRENEYSSYDWFVNGSDKDTHQELQYIGGATILRGMFIDGLDPTSSWYASTDHNGIAGYTYNFDDSKKYYLMNKNKERGLGDGLLYQRTTTSLAWQPRLTDEAISDSAAWYIEYNPNNGYYMFKNAETGKYITHSASSTTVSLKSTSSPSATEYFQLMPDRKDVTIGTGEEKITTHGYWFTWTNSGFKSMSANAFTTRLGYGSIAQAAFDYSDAATAQQWIIISEDELEAYQAAAVATGIRSIAVNDKSVDGSKKVVGIYTTGGVQLKETQRGFNVIKYSDGQVKKIYVK